MNKRLISDKRKVKQLLASDKLFMFYHGDGRFKMLSIAVQSNLWSPHVLSKTVKPNFND